MSLDSHCVEKVSTTMLSIELLSEGRQRTVSDTAWSETYPRNHTIYGRQMGTAATAAKDTRSI